jgi:hypothetical protein
VPTAGFDFDLVELRGLMDIGGWNVVVDPLPEPFAALGTSFSRVRRDASTALLRLTLRSGLELEVELEDGAADAATLLDGRSVVYLDQNLWSTMADWHYRRRSVAADEARACGRLASLVGRGEVVLPASAANLVETGPLFGQRRVNHAATLLEFSRGWQMRNPLHVRVEELTRALAGAPPRAADVFAPNADVTFDELGDREPALPTGFTPEVRRALALYGTMLEPVAIPDEEGKAAALALKWAHAFQRIAVQLREDHANPSLMRAVIREALVRDLTADIAHACGNTRSDPRVALDRLLDDDAFWDRMPFLGRLRHLLFARVRNAGQRWRKNDLIDCHSLACAAGYADHVAGENSAIKYLRQNPVHDTAPPTLSVSLAECIAAVCPSA